MQFLASDVLGNGCHSHYYQAIIRAKPATENGSDPGACAT